MRKLVIIALFTLFSYELHAQEIDSLKVLTRTDWHTVIGWLEKDTVDLFSRPKIDTNYHGLTTKEIRRKKVQNTYGERISFEEGELKYTNFSMCNVGEPLRKITAFNFKNSTVYIEFQYISWPWKDNDWIAKKREYAILKWSSDKIILK